MPCILQLVSELNSLTQEKEEWSAFFLTEQEPIHCLDRTLSLLRSLLFSKRMAAYRDNFQNWEGSPHFAYMQSGRVGKIY